MSVLTIVARNYVAHARVLTSSVRDTNPDTQVYVFVIDADHGSTPDIESAQILTPLDVFAPTQYDDLVARYSVIELATAVKPRVLRYLLDRTGDAVLYMDPDIQVFGSLAKLTAASRQCGVVLTPHNQEPIPRDGLRPTPRDLLIAGAYNLGFIGVSSKGAAFLHWWWGQLERECLHRPDLGYMLDQRWLDLAVTYFDCHIDRSPGCNVAYWNVWERDLTRANGAHWARGEPLVFFHFSGFDPHTPERLSIHNQPNPRLEVTDSEVLGQLSQNYARRLLKAGYAKAMQSRSRQPQRSVPAYHPGLFLVGYFRSEHGVGEAGRQIVRAALASDLPHCVWVSRSALQRQEHPFDQPDAVDNPFNVVVMCANADRFPSMLQEQGDRVGRGRYTVGVWFWETPGFPAIWSDRFSLVDELWVASDATAAAIQAVSDVPVYVIPLPVREPRPGRTTRLQLGLPARSFIALFCFDFSSRSDRKNPDGVLDAYCQAFDPGEGAFLVLKSINGHAHATRLQALRARAASRSDIRIWDEHLDVDKLDALLEASDVYISLHRAEGFGFTMAEAMALGKPVIATRHGGNLSFMDDSNSILVPADLVRVGPGKAPYLAADRWGEPDIGSAALALRQLRDHPELCRQIGRAARESLQPRLDASTAAAFMRRRFLAIQDHMREHRPVTLSASPPATVSLPENVSLPADALAAFHAIARRPRLFRAVTAVLGTTTRVVRRVRGWGGRGGRPPATR